MVVVVKTSVYCVGVCLLVRIRIFGEDRTIFIGVPEMRYIRTDVVFRRHFDLPPDVGVASVVSVGLLVRTRIQKAYSIYT